MTRGRTIVIGAGTNGLTTAALLARAGRDVLVLERRDVIGGLAASGEFHPGYRSAGIFHDTTLVRPHVVERLALVRHGLKPRTHPPDRLTLAPGGAGLLIPGDPARVASALGAVSGRDASAWGRYRAFLDRIRPCLIDFLDRPAVNLIDIDSAGMPATWDLLRRALRVRGLGRDDMMELIRVPALSMRDWLDEWFETGPFKAALAIGALSGNWLGPRSPGGAANLILHDALRGAGFEGSGHTVAAALQRAAESHGVTIRTGATVESILIRDGRTAGVALRGGEEIEAASIAASCDPKATFALLPAGAAPYRTRRRVEAFRMRGTTAQVLLALKAPPRFAARPGDAVAHATTGEDLDALERAFDAVKYRKHSPRPALEIHIPTVESPDLAPPGHAVVSCLVHFAPHAIEGGWTDAARERLGETVIGILEEHAPGIRGTIVSGSVLSPADIEQRYGVTGGHILHGEHALDQILIRPFPEWSGHATPLAGLFLCGSGAHPGGGLTCGPGSLAADAILKK